MQLFLRSLVLIAAFLITFYSCDSNKTVNNKPIAKVYDKYLYLSDVEDIFPQQISPNDSVHMLMAYVDRWVRKQLMVHRAEKNLTETQKNVAQQLDDYRSSLLIFKYEQEYIRQKLDTIISFDEISDFYNENNSNFILNESIVKALFVKIKHDDAYYSRIKELYRSNKEEDIKELDNIAYQVAIKYDYFNDQWIPLSKILRELPQPVSNPENFILIKRSIEMNDDNHAYLVNFREVINRGQISPISYEKDNIRSILLNMRKQRLIVELESKIYNDARNYNNFIIYSNQ